MKCFSACKSYQKDCVIFKGEYNIVFLRDRGSLFEYFNILHKIQMTMYVKYTKQL